MKSFLPRGPSSIIAFSLKKVRLIQCENFPHPSVRSTPITCSAPFFFLFFFRYLQYLHCLGAVFLTQKCICRLDTTDYGLWKAWSLISPSSCKWISQIHRLCSGSFSFCFAEVCGSSWAFNWKPYRSTLVETANTLAQTPVHQATYAHTYHSRRLDVWILRQMNITRMSSWVPSGLISWSKQLMIEEKIVL